MHVDPLVDDHSRAAPVDFLHDLLCLADVGVIADPHRNIQAPLRHHGSVCHRRIGERAVWNRQHTVVNCRDGRVHQADRLHCPVSKGSHHIIADPERLHQKYQNTAGHIRQASLQGHTDRQTCRAHDCDDGSRVDSQLPHDHEDEDRIHTCPRGRRQEFCNSHVNRCFGQEFIQQFQKEADQLFSNEKNDDRNNNIEDQFRQRRRY